MGIRYDYSRLPTDEFPVSVKQFPCSVQNRESSATHRNCSVNGRQNLAESVEMVGDRKNSLLFSLFSGNSEGRRTGLASDGETHQAFPEVRPMLDQEESR